MSAQFEAEEVTGAKAIEVATLLGDSVVDVKHCIDPKAGKVTPRTWAMLAAGAAALFSSAIAFYVSVSNAAFNKAALDQWTRVLHKPAYAYRPYVLSGAIDWLAFGGLAMGLAALAVGLLRMRDEKCSPYYRIGTSPDVEQAVEGAPTASFPLVAPSGDDFVFNFGAGISGDMMVDGKAVPFAELAAAGRAQPSPILAGAFEIQIPAKARIRANVGQTSFLVTSVARPRRFATPLLAVQNRTLAYFGGSLAGHLTLVLLLGLMPVESSTAAIDLASQEPTSINSKSIEHEDLTAEQEQERDPGSSRTEGKGAQMALAEGAAGTTKSTRQDGHIRIKKNADEPQVARTQAIEAATTAGIMGSVSLQDGAAFASLTGVSNLSSGFDDADVYGPLYGAEGEGHGYFGYGRHGFELGGGCAGAGCGIIGTEPGYGKIGTGRRGMNGWDGPGGGGPPGRRHVADVPVAVLGQPTTAGDLDKAIIRRYIKQNLSKIQYCYEKQLLAKSGLDGTVMVNFFITNMGTVKASVGSGMDAEVANCVAYVIAAIEFPKPRGGGGVQVNYPFTFHAAK